MVLCYVFRKENRELVQKYKEFIPFRIETVEYQEYQPVTAVAIEGQVEEVTTAEVVTGDHQVHHQQLQQVAEVAGEHHEIVMAVDSIQVPEG